MANKSIGSFQRKDYGSWEVWKKSYTTTQLAERRAQLARAVNSRLRRLETSKSYITGHGYSEYSQFDNIYGYLESHGKRRFSESKSYGQHMSKVSLKQEISMLEEFLSMKSSTVGGIRSIEEKRVDTFISKGVPESIATDVNFWQFLNSQTFEYLSDVSLNSEDIVEFFETGADEGLSVEEIITAFEEHKNHVSSGWKGMRERLRTKGAMKRKTGEYEEVSDITERQ